MSKVKADYWGWITILPRLLPEFYPKMNAGVTTADIFGHFAEEVDR